jgi:hypothetical protein
MLATSAPLLVVNDRPGIVSKAERTNFAKVPSRHLLFGATLFTARDVMEFDQLGDPDHE